MDYFNNATIVDLVERPHRGVLAVLDEACSAAGTITDRIFLQSLDTHHRHHPHYSSRQVPLCPCDPTPSMPSLSWAAPPGGVLPALVGLPSSTAPCTASPDPCLDPGLPPLPLPSSAPRTRPWSLAETSGSSTMQGMSRKAPSPS